MNKKKKITRWFTFGQAHKHFINGFRYDKDVVVEITAENPREEMFKIFGNKWAFEYNDVPEMLYYSRGIKKIKL